MRTILFIGAMLTLSITAVGQTPGPDRQSQDLIDTVQTADFVQPFAADFVITTNTIVEADTILITDQEAVALDHAIDLTIPDGITVSQIAVIRPRTDLVIEDSKVAWQEYVLPIWDYEPSIEPPSVTLS